MTKTERRIERVTKPSSEVVPGDRVSRRDYVREVVSVRYVRGDVELTINKGFGEVVHERYAPTAEVELIYEVA